MVKQESQGLDKQVTLCYTSGVGENNFFQGDIL